MNDHRPNKPQGNSSMGSDFSKLGKELGRSLNNALENAFEEARKVRDGVAKATTQAPHKPPQTNRYAKRAYRRHPIGHVSGILLTVFGIIGIIGFGVPALVLALLNVGKTVSTVFIGLVFLSLYGKYEGDRIRKRLKRYQHYNRIINNRTSCTLKEISSHQNTSEKYVYKDLKRMIRVGMFPDANFNKNKTVIMMTRQRYDQYLQQEAQFQDQARAQKAADQRSYSPSKIEIQDNWPSIEKAGQTYVKAMNDLKVSLSDVDMVGNIHKTQILTGKILEYAQKKSKDPNDVRRLMNYYLPETLKLLTTYKELEDQPITGANITSAKAEISRAILSINEAFEQLFDSLFEEEALNVSADISVLNTVFSQNGLKDDGLNPNNEGA